MIKSFQQIQLSQYTANYYEVGQGHPLVFLHGFLGDSHAWDSLIPLLSDNYRCICLDLLGFGDSSKPDIDFTIAAEVDFLNEFIEYLGLKKFSLIGHSFGGWISSSFSIHKPENNLNSIVLLAPGGIRDDSFRGNYKYVIPLLLPNIFIDVIIDIISPLFSLLKMKDKVIQFRKIRQLFRERPVASSFALRKFLDKNPDRETVDHQLEEIDVLTIVISGTDDNVIPLWHAETYANKIRNSHAVFIPKASHNLIDTHPHLIADKICNTIPTLICSHLES